MSKEHTILVVDDEDINLRIIEGMLAPMNYELIKARSGEEAIVLANSTACDLILLDVMMHKMDGFQTAKILKASPNTKLIPIVIITALNEVSHRVQALEAGADDFLTKPVDAVELRARVKSLIKVKAYNDLMENSKRLLEDEVRKKTLELQKAYDEIRETTLESIYRLSKAAEFRDEGTGAHILRLSQYAAIIAEAMGQKTEFVNNLFYAVPMHDIGKIGIPDSILLKPGKLDTNEWQIMKLHPAIGKKMLENSRSRLIQMAEQIAISHHEKWDGSGYPYGLKGDDIPIAGQITALVDVFDALTSKRPYRDALSDEESISIIQKGSNVHFSSQLVAAFSCSLNRILTVKKAYLDNRDSILFSLANSVMKGFDI